MRGARALRRGLLLAVVAMAALRPAPALAQAPEDLAAARKLFGEALGDQEARRYEAALEKFRRVEAVKDTANVRYRIASCLEALGRQAEALTNYEAAVKLGEGEPGAGEVARVASSRAAQLDRVVPRLSIVVPADAPSGTEVRVDDVPVDRQALSAALPLDPGHHTIAAAAPARMPFQTGVTLPEGARVSITVTLEPSSRSAATSVSTAGSTSSAVPPPTGTATSGPVPESPPRSTPTGAYVLLGVGGVLAAGSIVSLVLRQSNLNTLSSDCQTLASGNFSCPQSHATEVNNARSAAQIEGPLAIGLAGGAVAALASGVWLMMATPSAAPGSQRGVRVAPVLTKTGGLLTVGSAF